MWSYFSTLMPFGKPAQNSVAETNNHWSVYDSAVRAGLSSAVPVTTLGVNPMAARQPHSCVWRFCWMAVTAGSCPHSFLSPCGLSSRVAIALWHQMSVTSLWATGESLGRSQPLSGILGWYVSLQCWCGGEHSTNDLEPKFTLTGLPRPRLCDVV